MRLKHLIRLCCAAALVQMAACSSIKELFPDKEKDYQFTTEIPKLTIPADLANGSRLTTPTASSMSVPATTVSSIPTTPATPQAETIASIEPTKNRELPTATTAHEEPSRADVDDTAEETNQPFVDSKSITVSLLQSTTNTSYLRIGAPLLRAWRIVSKGLSRQSIEVSDRNQDDKIFTVQYDSDEQPVKDDTYLDEINFMLHGFQGNEKEYKLKLIETNQQTDVIVINEQQQAVSDEGSLKLLKVLEKSITTNLAGK